MFPGLLAEPFQICFSVVPIDADDRIFNGLRDTRNLPLVARVVTASGNEARALVTCVWKLTNRKGVLDHHSMLVRILSHLEASGRHDHQLRTIIALAERGARLGDAAMSSPAADSTSFRIAPQFPASVLKLLLTWCNRGLDFESRSLWCIRSGYVGRDGAAFKIRRIVTIVASEGPRHGPGGSHAAQR